ncbi:NmrA family transcriptional regulator [Bisporella sp. PMI_857]|nr:NmrA family transcriptional regulator [Bisporella sp. PMI_857]
MTKALAVFGATGHQGGSLIDYILTSPELSEQYTLRAITRTPESAPAISLQKQGVKVVFGDADIPDSLPRALEGANTVFLLTSSIWDATGRSREIAQGRAIADASVAAGAPYLIFSTLPNVSEISGGKYRNVDHFDAKAEVEKYIRTLPIGSSFFQPAAFMQNFAAGGGLHPQPAGDGTFAIRSPASPSTLIPLFDPVSSSGFFITKILADPEEILSLEQIAEVIARKSGKKVAYHKVEEVPHRREMTVWGMSSHAIDTATEMLLYYETFGYYRPGTEKVAEAARQSVGDRSCVLGFEGWLERIL